MILKDTTALESEVAEARRTIASDGYPMSIGELTNLYRDGELVIRPEFQRLFRWSDLQKSRLVESILLGIPLPSIFVAQQEQGRWELVDGLQRVSTILQLQGELLDPDGKTLPPLRLIETKFLRDLEGRTWNGTRPDTEIPNSLRLDVKRAKIDIKIIKRESSPQAKFDLFQRLNSFGSTLTAQEMRSALLAAVSKEFLVWLESLAKYENFVETTGLSERLIDERYDLELVLRFLVLHNRSDDKLTQSALRDLPQLLDDESVRLATLWPRSKDRLERTFWNTFDVIAENGGDVVFRRWDAKRKEFAGSFLNTAFEVFALGIAYHIANKRKYRRDLVEVVRRFWARSSMKSGYATGKSTEARLSEFVPLGRTLLGT